jgi:Ca2+-binding RTX toxin-like protein
MVIYVGDINPNTQAGSAFADDMDGQGGNDTLNGLAGNDSVLGGTGNDFLLGGAGRDTVLGGLDNDIINDAADDERDILDGGDGDDIIVGAGRDAMQGGAGFDNGNLSLRNFTAVNIDLTGLVSGGSITFAKTTLTGFEALTVTLTSGDDKASGPNFASTLNGGTGNDTLVGGTKRDTLIGGIALTNDADVLRGGDGDDALLGGLGDRLDGGAGTFDFFTLDLSSATLDFSVNFAPVATGGAVNLGGGTVIAGCEIGSVSFGSGDDLIKSGSAAGGQVVSVYGGAGRDTLIGGDGDDFLEGQEGQDVIKGGLGFDQASYSGAVAGVRIDLNLAGWQQTGGDGWEQLASIEAVYGSDFGDRLVGDAAANRLTGSSGADTLIGGLGDDTLSGGFGAADGTDLDRLIGGAGRDVYTGGGDVDVMVWATVAHTAAAAPDLITDLEAGDLIDLGAIDADTGLGGDQAFTLVGALTGVAGQLAVSFDGSKTSFAMDVNGDGVADGLIEATGDHTGHTAFVL